MRKDAFGVQGKWVRGGSRPYDVGDSPLIPVVAHTMLPHSYARTSGYGNGNGCAAPITLFMRVHATAIPD